VKKKNMLRCCFCGGDTAPDDYIQLELGVAGSETFQQFGAHRAHLQNALAPGFKIHLPEPVDYEDDE
jgi:hypothetical protein